MSALCERAAIGSLALGSVALAHVLWPEPAPRGEALALGVVTLGYGHLLGAAWLGWPRLAARRPPGMAAPLFALWLGTGALAALGAWAWAAARWPSLTLLLLGVSVWHTVENDVALFRGGALPDRAPPRLRDPAARARVAAWCLALGVWVASTPAWHAGFGARLGPAAATGLRVTALGAAALALGRGRGAGRWSALPPALAAVLPAPPLALVDLFAATTLHHLYSWLGVLARRATRLQRRGAREAARRLVAHGLALHALPAAACLGVASSRSETLGALRPWLLGPGLYLFWSLLHVLHTAWTRSSSPRPRSLGDPA